MWHPNGRCESENPNHLFRPVSFPKELIDPVEGKRVPPAERQKVVMINRSGPHRRSNTEEIMRELKSRWPKVEYAVFDDSFANSRPLSDHIAMFASAKVIIGAHGAGLANMMWSAPATVVIETGFDQSRHLQHSARRRSGPQCPPALSAAPLRRWPWRWRSLAVPVGAVAVGTAE